MERFLYLDFEFHSSNEKFQELICGVCYTERDGYKQFWLADKNYEEMRNYLLGNTDCVFVGYSCEAEMRSLHALGFNPRLVEWIDLHVFHKLALNFEVQKTITNYIDETGEEIEIENTPEQYKRNLIGLCELCNIPFIDSDEKKKMISYILSKDKTLIELNKEKILNYCQGDVEVLPEIHAVIKEYEEYENLKSLSHYALTCAEMTTRGIPLSMNMFDKLIKNRDQILESLYVQSSFHTKDKKGKWSFKVKQFEEFINEKFNSWPATEKGSLKRDGETLKLHMGLDPKIAHLFETKEIQQVLNRFSPKNSVSTLGAIGSDNRIRTYWNSYGSKTSRSQPPAKTYPLLWSRPLRCIVNPPPGKKITEFDFSSQEVLIAAIMPAFYGLTPDYALISSYLSGDIYFDFAKISGAVPQDADIKEAKTTYKLLRQAYKSTVLGIQYGMGKDKLALKLTGDTGHTFTSDDSYKLIRDFKMAYPTYDRWKQKLQQDFKNKLPVVLLDGWSYKVNEFTNATTYCNLPVQGNAAVLMRMVANELSQKYRLIATLHDGFYVELEDKDMESENNIKVIMQDCFKKLFATDYIIGVESKSIIHKQFKPSFKSSKSEELWGKIREFILPDYFLKGEEK